MNNLFLSQQQLRIGPKLPSFMTSKQRKIDAAGFFFFKQKSFNKKKKKASYASPITLKSMLT